MIAETVAPRYAHSWCLAFRTKILDIDRQALIRDAKANTSEVPGIPHAHPAGELEFIYTCMQMMYVTTDSKSRREGLELCGPRHADCNPGVVIDAEDILLAVRWVG